MHLSLFAKLVGIPVSRRLFNRGQAVWGAVAGAVLVVITTWASYLKVVEPALPCPVLRGHSGRRPCVLGSCGPFCPKPAILAVFRVRSYVRGASFPGSCGRGWDPPARLGSSGPFGILRPVRLYYFLTGRRIPKWATGSHRSGQRGYHILGPAPTGS